MALEIRFNKPLFRIINPSRFNVATTGRIAPTRVKDTVNIASDFDKYMSFEALYNMLKGAKADPEIQKIAKELGLPLKKISMNISHDLKDHVILVRDLLIGMYKNLSQEYKPKINLQKLLKAAIAHDVGKTALPENIISKKGAYGSFTEYENKVKEFHPVLGAAMLKAFGEDEEICNWVKYHHRQLKGGYPQANKDFECTFAQQMFHVADEASAMLVKRSYATPQDKNKALAILENEMQQGDFHPAIYQALSQYLNALELTKTATAAQEFRIMPQKKPSHSQLINSLCAIFFRAQ